MPALCVYFKSMKSSIIDVPRKHDQEDLFGIKVYQDALIKYIKLTDTPITIALQGEWGSGKTSLMNLLRWNLCDVDNAPYYPIWINTWQYSLMENAGLFHHATWFLMKSLSC